MHQSHASSTARLIAAGTVMAAREPGFLAPPSITAVTWCERFLSTTRRDRLLLFTARSATGRMCWRIIERLTISGILAHWMQRKRHIEKLARQAASGGFTQLVIVGAGLDTLPFRMCDEHVFQNIVAVDHPHTQAVVRAALASPPQVKTHVELVPVDLAKENLADAISRSVRRFDADQSTLFVIEGVLMYMPEQAVLTTLRAISGLRCPRLRLVGTYMDRVAGVKGDRREPIAFRPQSPIVGLWLRIRGETMRWSIADASLPVLLESAGWRSVEIFPAAGDGPARISSQGPDGENIFVAQR